MEGSGYDVHVAFRGGLVVVLSLGAVSDLEARLKAEGKVERLCKDGWCPSWGEVACVVLEQATRHVHMPRDGTLLRRGRTVVTVEVEA